MNTAIQSAITIAIARTIAVADTAAIAVAATVGAVSIYQSFDCDSSLSVVMAWQPHQY